MKRPRSFWFAALFAFGVAFLGAPAASADDAVANRIIASVVARPEYAQEFEGFHIYFGDTPRPAGRIVERDAQTSMRTRKLGRSSEEACQWVLLSALIQLRDHARTVGGNALVNVRSNWQNQQFSSRGEYQCAAGFLMAGVALKADIANLR